MKKRMLVVNDDEGIQVLLARLFGEKLDIFSAFTLEQGKKLFGKNPTVDLVVMDGCVDNQQHELDSIELTREIRATYQGPMLACSSFPDYNNQLMKAGCDYNVGDLGLIGSIKKILGI